MIDLLIDPHAERVIAGCAIASNEGATLATDRITPADFHDPLLWQLVATAATTPTKPATDNPIELPDEARTRHVATATGRPYRDLWTIVTARPCWADRSGYWAGRVLDAADRRRRAARLIGDLEDLGLNVYIAP